MRVAAADGLTAIGRLLFVVVIAGNAVASLKLTKMTVPPVIDYKEELQLDCQFDMGGEQLYAVKWYKDDHEFFRFMPNQEPHELNFPVFGVNLDKQHTECGQTRCKVVLAQLMRVKSGGAYRCEVSTEAPAFRLASETHNVTVAAVPQGDPSIEGLEDSYFDGDILTAKCISAASDPPQLITWFINEEQAPSKFVRDMKTSKPDHEGLVSTSQLIRFVVESQHTAPSTGAAAAVGATRKVRVTCSTAFEGTPASARRTTKSAALYDRGAQINNPKFTYWYSSSSGSALRATATAAATTLALALFPLR